MVEVLVPLGVIGWMVVMVGMIARLFTNISLNLRSAKLCGAAPSPSLSWPSG